MIFNKEKRKQAMYRQTFNSPQGSKVLHDLVQRHYVFQTTHVAGDPYSSAFQEGRRAVVVDILRFLETDLEFLQQQIRTKDDE